ncbi:MAG: Sau3AI family type II restriction endonuclease [Eubacteriales bacterium]|nr:Sau3AI family type II restriction endonuclease [Eubacteriales bacterium]
MRGTEYKTKEAILQRAQEAIGIPLKKIDTTGRLLTGKGAIGTVIEESWFGYHPNSESSPDFPEAGVELKVTPYLRKRSGITAKERLVCNIINYMDEYRKTFEDSSFWHKCETMLLMSYEHQHDVPKYDYKIDKAILFSFPTEDLIIIKQDWEKIIRKIRSGEAHLITEGDTLYLAACTKGTTAATSMRKQPFSHILAKQRAYSLKSSYMTHILRAYVFGDAIDEHIIKDWHELISTDFESYVIAKVSPYIGKTQVQLKSLFNIESTAKNLNEILLAKMLGVTGKIAYTDEFQSANIIPKTIRVQRNGHIKESMSFPTFKFTEIINETWEESKLREYLEPAKFLFVIFHENRNGEYVFERLKFWNIPMQDLEEVHNVWSRTVQIIKDGVVLTFDGRVTHNNFPKSTESSVSHIRPHAKNLNDTYPLPDGREMPKQCFWFNREYVESIIFDQKDTTSKYSP